jgi:hypothetical protein
MKQLFIFLFASILSIAISAQGNGQGKGKGTVKSENNTSNDKSNNKEKDKDTKDRTDHEKKIWVGTYTKTSDGPKPSKNQPAKVRSAFQRDYPNASNVYWSKYRGDWTATFRNGLWMSTAVYHANGDRRDTRTIVQKESIPKKIFDIISKKPDVKMDDVIKIEVPKVIKDIFRIKNVIDGKTQYTFYDSEGSTVQYNY